ncbi:OmpH family outer membrane protein [Lutibacter maritimus]|uniref:Periplasmic chaperone for outer membrane proteins Skp n=1 Tax=Lutibacter maritimus TaxID=593133 RepID=A0A1I6PLQ7_9FLAO|nr:OmpH family outer membrane protein [Lutibacter maritimus]SFS41106.1 periplasmic chaperone for outer membrane proteins Skp [Lutibacter maritimus]
MKKLLIIAFAVVLASCNQTKVAYVDVEVLMKDYEGTIALESKMKEKQEAKAKELDSLTAPFQAKVQNYYKSAQSMSPQKRAEAEGALQQEQQFIQAQQQQASQELQTETQESYEAITKVVDSLVGSYAKSNGFNIIFGTSGKGTVMYGDENLDVTKQVLEMLNKEYSK